VETPSQSDDRAPGGPSDGPLDASQAHPVRTPEEVARAFLQEGGVVVPGPDVAPLFHWRWSVVAGVAVAAAALVALAAFTLLTTGNNNPPPPSHQAAARPPGVTNTGAGHHAAATSTTTSTTTPATANTAVSVDVLNASSSNGVAGLTAAALQQDGFTVTGIGTAPTKIAGGAPSQIRYGPSGLTAAHTLAASLAGPVSLVPDPSVTDSSLTLLVASTQLSVIPSTTTTTAPGGTTTTTTAPAGASSSP
jgi:hypothetical protein